LSGTAITIVAPIDGKSVTAIERLIGQTIPWMGEPAPVESRETRESRPREGERSHRGGRNRGREHPPQPRQDREPPRAAQPQPRSNQEPARDAKPQPPRPQPQPQRSQPQPQPQHAEESDGSHLPAFLLRPVSLKA
jgi:hypothetical protein